MTKLTLDSKAIDVLRDLPDMIPVFREFYQDWTIRVFNREQYDCRNYLSPNRREFYKVLLFTKGIGVFTMGLNTYYMDEPTVLFIHPNDIISWKNLSDESGGYYVLFRKQFIHDHPQLKATIDKYGLFTQKEKSVIRLATSDVPVLTGLFERMEQEEQSGNELGEDAMQAYLQLLLIESMRVAQYPKPNSVSDEFRYIHQFFQLLEQQAAAINYTTPIRIKTAKEFASSLAVHPNYLNALLKKHTGQPVSIHIRNRLLEETKVLLLRTDWSLYAIGQSIGFSEPSNFNLFFKKNTGMTPAEFRKTHHS